MKDKIKFNTELNIYYGLFSYTEIINLIDNGATPTGGYQYSKKDLQHEIGTGRNLSTYFYFNINSDQLEKFGQNRLTIQNKLV